MKERRVIKCMVFIISLTLIVIFSFHDCFAAYVGIATSGEAKVLQIIDGDALKVQSVFTNEVALVRLAGVDATGFDDAVSYMNSELLGQIVYLELDATTFVDGRWNMALVYKNGTLINSALLEKGYAKFAEGYSGDLRDTFMASEISGKDREIGLWAPNDRLAPRQPLFTGNGVNINTCSPAQLAERLSETDADIALRISENLVRYRNYSPFRNASEVKFVDGFTREIYASNRNLFSVCTNINLATKNELITLTDFTEEDVEKILEYREDHDFVSLSQLYSENLISQSKYETNLPYMSLSNVQEIHYAIPNRAANINTASRSQLMNAGVSSSIAERIVSNREGYQTIAYTYKSIGELSYIINTDELNRLADNLTTVTDINNAGMDEIYSLFGDSIYQREAEILYQNRPYDSPEAVQLRLTEEAYNHIEGHFTLTQITSDLININIANETQLTSIGLSDTQTASILSLRRSIYEPRQIPSDVMEFENRISLYTNINNADLSEIQNLLWSADPSSGIVNELISARNNQPFGSQDELRTFFDERGQLNVYNFVSRFIVFR